MYYKPIEIEDKPFLVFDVVAQSDEELIARKLCEGEEKEDGGKTVFTSSTPLTPVLGVFRESELPEETFGICPVKLSKDGTLVPREKETLDLAERQWQAKKDEKDLENIDKATRKKIAQGFAFDGQTFSLSPNAQINWQGLYLLVLAGKFGEAQPITTKDNTEYILTKEKAQEFLDAATLKVKSELNSGRQLKINIISK